MKRLPQKYTFSSKYSSSKRLTSPIALANARHLDWTENVLSSTQNPSGRHRARRLVPRQAKRQSQKKLSAMHPDGSYGPWATRDPFRPPYDDGFTAVPLGAPLQHREDHQNNRPGYAPREGQNGDGSFQSCPNPYVYYNPINGPGPTPGAYPGPFVPGPWHVQPGFTTSSYAWQRPNDQGDQVLNG